MDEAVILDRTSALAVGVVGGWQVDATVASMRRRAVRNVLRNGVLAADLRDADVVCLAGLGEGVVSTIEVLALLRQRCQQAERTQGSLDLP